MKKINFFYIAGILLIAASAALLITNKNNTAEITTNNQQAVAQIQQLLPPRTTAVAGQYTNTAMSVYEIDGIDYCALLECKTAGVVLPVADSWDNAEKTSARCHGSVYDSTMIIGGQGLGFVTQLDLGNKITVVDMLGGEYSYTVDKIDRAKEVDMEKLSSKDHNLIVFSYIAKEKKYVIVRCNG